MGMNAFEIAEGNICLEFSPEFFGDSEPASHDKQAIGFAESVRGKRKIWQLGMKTFRFKQGFVPVNGLRVYLWEDNVSFPENPTLEQLTAYDKRPMPNVLEFPVIVLGKPKESK